MSIPQHGGPAGRRPLPLSPRSLDGQDQDPGDARPATIEQWPVPPIDRPGRPRFDGWAGPPAHLDPDLAGPDSDPEPRSRRWPLVVAALVVVAGLGVAAAAVATRSGSEPPPDLGTVGAAEGARVRTSEGAEPRDLEEGETVLDGWVVDAGDGPGVVIDLAAGGVLRFDEGATLSFTAGGADEAGPAAHIDGGRTWFNPAGVSESAAVVLATDDVTLTSTGNPVALDCTIGCTAQAPAGGVKVSTEDGIHVAPVPDEAVMVTSDGGLVMRTLDEPSPWVRQNLDADAVDLPPPTPVRSDGVTAGALPAGAYALDLAVTSNGEGTPLNPSLTWARGQTARSDARVEAADCTQVPCDVPVTATLERGGTTFTFEGALHIENRSMALTLARPVECPPVAADGAPSRTVGTATMAADMTVSEAAYDDSSRRWIATVMGGPGTMSLEITDATCEAVPNSMGAQTNTLEMTGHAAG